MGSRILLICGGQCFIYLSKEKTEEKKVAPLGNPPTPATRLMLGQMGQNSRAISMSWRNIVEAFF